jgi:(R,R)-butanediol dehydrogenase / meso-butanediol dehydrogenase / diacetyl reductase
MLAFPEEMIPSGLVLGHEFTGTISELGSGVEGWHPGDRVTVLPMVACGHCYACRAGHPNLCENGISHGPGLGRQGAYAEAVVVPEAMLRRLPESVSDAHGALTEPLAVAIRGIKLSGATPDEGVCVLGAGPIGVMTGIGLRARGFERVVVVEPNQGRRGILERLGFVAVAPDAADEAVPAALGGALPTVVIDCTGHPSGVPLAVDLLPPAGCLVVVGIPNDPVALSLITLAMKEIVMRGSLAYSDEDFAEALDHIAGGRVPCDEVITIADLEDAGAWFADLGGGASEQVKVLLRT